MPVRCHIIPQPVKPLSCLMSRFCNKRPGSIKASLSYLQTKLRLQFCCFQMAHTDDMHTCCHVVPNLHFWKCPFKLSLSHEQAHCFSAELIKVKLKREEIKSVKYNLQRVYELCKLMQHGKCKMWEKKKGELVCEENVWPQVMDYWKPLPQDTILQWQVWLRLSVCQSASVFHPVL